jgi:hypothetical protein
MQGPVEYLLVKFTQPQFEGRIAAALADLVGKGIVHVIDLVVVAKGQDGTVTVIEADSAEIHELADVDGEAGGLLSEEDVLAAAEQLAPGDAAALLVWEQVWAAPFAQAIRDAGGQLVANDYIPGEIVDAALASIDG